MKNQKNESLKERWKLFWEIIADPSVSLLLLVLFIIYVLKVYNSTTSLDLFYSVVLAILASVWGGIVSNRWIKLTDEQALAARGKGAVQSLNLLLSVINNIEDRIKKFKGCCEDVDPNKPLLKSNLEEIEESLKSLKQIGYNSIENWQDVVPEADLKSHFIELQEITNKLIGEQEKVNNLEKHLENTQLEASRVKELQNEVETKRNEVNNLKQQLINCQMNSPSGSSYDYYNQYNFIKNCPNCSRSFNDNQAGKDIMGCKTCPYCSCRIY